MTRPASRHRLVRAAVEVLGDKHLTANQLAEQLAAAGVELGPDGADHLHEVLDESTEVWELGDDSWVACGPLLDGTTWSTVIDAADAADGVLPIDPDLHALGWWATNVPLAWRDQAGAVVLDGDDRLVGPPGWLDGLAGAVLVRLDGRSVDVALAASTPSPTPEHVAAVRAGFAAEAVEEELVSSLLPGDAPQLLRFAGLDSLVWAALAADPATFRAAPVPPVDVLLAAAGLERSGFDVAEQGCSWHELERWRQRQQLAWMHRLEPDDVDLAEILIGASLAVFEGADDPLGPREEEPQAAQLLAYALASPAVSLAFWGHHARLGTDPVDLLRFAERLLAHLSGPLRAGPAWLAGRAADLTGDAAAAEAWFVDAVESGAEHAPSLVGLAAFRADRGDAPGAMRLLRRAAEEGDPQSDDLVADLADEVGSYVAHRPAPLARRNDPCPCGSGRKYKACHLGQERHRLIDRGPWLYAKARRYVRDNRFRRLTAELAGAMVGPAAEVGCSWPSCSTPSCWPTSCSAKAACSSRSSRSARPSCPTTRRSLRRSGSSWSAACSRWSGLGTTRSICATCAPATG